MPRPDPRSAELDELTLRRARTGDQRACTRFVAHYQRRVFAAISRIMGTRAGPARVEELAQDAFLRALRALPRFDLAGSARLSTWLLTIATRVALNELRRNAPTVTPLVDASRVAAPDELERVAQRQSLQRAIDALTAEQRAVVVLHDLHGLSDREVAEALELAVAAVKSRLFRARAALRRALTEDDDG